MDEQKLNELIYELKRLVDTIGNKQPGSSGGSIDTDKLIRALGLLAAKIDKKAQSEKDEIKSINNFAKSIDLAAAAVNNQAEELRNTKKRIQEEAAARLEARRLSKLTSRQIAQESRNNIIDEARSRKTITESQEALAKNFSSLGISLGNSASSLGKTFQQASIMGQGFKNTISAVGSFTAGMQNGVKGFTALNPVIDAAATAFSGFPILGGFVKAAAEGTKMLINQLSQTVDNFQTLGKVGGLTAEGMSGLQKQFHTSGQTLESYTNTISNNSQTLARFAGSVSDGAEIFSKTAGTVQKRFGTSLQMLGYGINEIGETTAAYIARQTRLGMTQGKSVNQLAAGSAKYAVELDELARLTGASKNELIKQQDEALKEQRFRAVIDKMKASGDAEQIAQAERLIAAQAALSKENSELGKGFRDLVSGIPSSEDANKLLRATGFQGQEIVGRAATQSVADTVNQFRDSVKIMLPEIRDLAAIGAADEVYGTYYKLSDFATGVVRDGEKVKNTQSALIAGSDDLTKTTVQAQRAMQNAMIELNRIGFELLPEAAGVIEAFTKMIEKALRDVGSDIKIDRQSKAKAKSALENLPGGKDVGDGTVGRAARHMQSSTGLQIANFINELLGLVKSDTSATSKDANTQKDLPKFADGGVATGPASGHLAMLHGTEAVIPLSGGSIPLKILGGSGLDQGPVFNPQTETNFLLEKNNTELSKAVVTLEEILKAIIGGATITSGGGGGGTAAVAQEALAEHDHAHPHEPAAPADPELAKQIGTIVNPLEKMVQTSGFVRNDGKTGHGAIDLAGKIGDKIMAPISGVARVLSEKESGGYGNMVEVTDEKTGIKHMLAHMDKTMVKTGDVIKAGQQIGTLGNTGKSTGAHLHHEMRDKTGKKIDPSQFYTGLTDPSGRLVSRPGFGTTAGGAATGYPHMTPRGRGAPTMSDGLGKMSEKYETGGRGSGTVGWDKVGGTSYGKYQIASKVGAMKDFLKFAEQSGRGDVAKKLRDAGAETDTGGTSGKSVDVWKQMAAGGELGDLEHQFIKKRSFDPAMAGVKDPKLKKMIEGNKGLQEMMWSTAVQHGGGGASGIMNKVYKEGMSQEDLVKAVYAERGTRFGGSTAEVQKSVKNRFIGEQGDVMAMLGMPAGKGGTMTAAAAPGMPAAGAAPGMPAAGAAPAGGGGLMGMLGGMFGGGAQAPAAGGGLMGMLGGMFGGGATATATPLAGVTAGGAPGAIGGDISAITQAMQAQTEATQTAITSGMENLTTQLVDKIGGGGTAADPAVPALLSEILSAQREQTGAINRLIQVNTS